MFPAHPVADLGCQSCYQAVQPDYGSRRSTPPFTLVTIVLAEGSADVNAQVGHFGNALQAASYEEGGEIVRQLLERGANVNAQGGQYGNALQAASYGGGGEHNIAVRVVDLNRSGLRKTEEIRIQRIRSLSYLIGTVTLNSAIHMSKNTSTSS